MKNDSNKAQDFNAWFGNRQMSGSALFERLQFLRGALDHSVVLSITDACGVIQYVNEKFCNLSRYSVEELIGQPYRIVNSGHHPKEFFEEMWSTIRQGRIWEGEVCNKAKDGTVFWLMTTIIPYKGAEGTPSQFLAIRMDITKRKQAEEQIRQLTADLEEQVRQKTAHLEALNEEFFQTIQRYSALFSTLKQILVQAGQQDIPDISHTAPISSVQNVSNEQIQAYKALSEREREVFRFLVEGKTNQEISDTLSISTHTVKSHVSSIIQKLHVTDRTTAAILGIKLRTLSIGF